MGYKDDVPLQDKIAYSVDYSDDQSVLLYIGYDGPQESGILDIAATTGDMTFKHGVLSSEVVDTDTKLDAGAVGLIDLSADVASYFDLDARINSSDNWWCALNACLPSDDPDASGTGDLLTVVGASCMPAGGYGVLNDTSQSKWTAAAMTFLGSPSTRHGTDHQTLHELHRVTALSTFASGTSILAVYACDDDDGTEAIILTLDAGATTGEVVYPLATHVLSQIPLTTVRGKRLVVYLINSVEMSVSRMKIEGYKSIIGPSARKSKLWSENQ